MAKSEYTADEKKLATKLHDKLCHWNHTDGCGWHYEDWSRPGYARKEYGDRARKILAHIDLETALRVVKEL